MNTLRTLLPGTLFSFTLALATLGLLSIPALSRLPLSPLLVALTLGAAAGNFFRLPRSLAPGIRFSAKSVLKSAVVLLGTKLTLEALGQVGWFTVAGIVVVTAASIGVTFVVGRRLGLPKRRSLLVAGGVSICGAAAVAAVASAVRAEETDTAFAVGAVTLFGTISMFVYPALFVGLHLPPLFYGRWTGASVHEVAQVAAAGAVLPEPFAALATTVKMIRVLLVIPVTLGLAMLARFRQAAGPKVPFRWSTLPWFALGFFAVVVLHSLIALPGGVVSALNRVDDALMATAMAALGAGISFRHLASIGRTALIAGLAGSFFIAVFGAAVMAMV